MSARTSIACRWCFQEGLCLRALSCGDAFLHVAGVLRVAAFLYVALYKALCLRDPGSCILSENKKALHDRPCGSVALVSFWSLEHQCVGAEKLLQMGFPLHRLNIGNNTERDAWLAIFWCILLQVFLVTTSQELHSLAGNSMHLRAIAVTIAAAMTASWPDVAHACRQVTAPWVRYAVAGCGPPSASDVAALRVRRVLDLT